MKRLLFLIILTALSIGAFSQTRARTGLSVGDHKKSGTDVTAWDSTTIVGRELKNYKAGTQLTTVDNPLDVVDASTVFPALADTIPIATFGMGTGGNDTDTLNITTTSIYGSFFNKGSDTIVVTSLKAAIATGSGTSTVGVQISWSDTLLAVVPTVLNTVAFTVNATTPTIGVEDTSFDNQKIPPNKWVWCTTPTISIGNKPKYLTVTLSGYKIPTY